MSNLGLVALVGGLLAAVAGYLFARRSGQRREAVRSLEASREKVREKLAKLKEEVKIVTPEEERAIQTAERMSGEADVTKDRIEAIDKVLDGIFSRYPPPGAR